MSRALSDLDPRFRPFAFELIARLVERNLLVIIVCTGRTAAEQALAVKSGRSQVAHSKHQDGLAIDLAPWDTWMAHGSNKVAWEHDNPAWRIMGEIGEGLGLRWGGRFKPVGVDGVGWDPGHFELVVTDHSDTIPT